MTRIIAVKNYISSRSNIEWSIMFISFAMVWMVSGYFYSPDQTLNKCPDYIDTVVIAFIGPDSNHQVETTFLCKVFRKDTI